MKLLTGKHLSALLLCGLMSGAFAQNVYLQGSFGAVDIGQSLPVEATDANLKGSGRRLTLGTKMTKEWAIEGVYVSYGQADWTEAGIKSTTKVDGYGLMGIYEFRHNQVILAGGLGLMRNRALNTNREGVLSTRAEWQPAYRLGAGYQVSDVISLHADYDFSYAQNSEGSVLPANQSGAKFSKKFISAGLRINF